MATLRLYALGFVLAAGALLVKLGVVDGQGSAAMLLLAAAVGFWISERESTRRCTVR